MIAEACTFETDRLLVRPWHDPPRRGRPRRDLATTVAEIMTEPVTRFLPDGWQGEYSTDRARDWIAQRDDESPTLLVVERSTGKPAGLVILFEAPIDAGLLSIRLGYLLAETAWGKGLAVELLRGLIGWCGEQPGIGSIIGGVAPANNASRRVLERLGFSVTHGGEPGGDDEVVYELQLDGRQPPLPDA